MSFRDLLERRMVNFPDNDLGLKISRTNLVSITGINCTGNTLEILVRNLLGVF
jgi:hypothetical protein